jgi:hypothetical protein
MPMISLRLEDWITREGMSPARILEIQLSSNEEIMVYPV